MTSDRSHVKPTPQAPPTAPVHHTAALAAPVPAQTPAHTPALANVSSAVAVSEVSNSRPIVSTASAQGETTAVPESQQEELQDLHRLLPHLNLHPQLPQPSTPCFPAHQQLLTWAESPAWQPRSWQGQQDSLPAGHPAGMDGKLFAAGRPPWQRPNVPSPAEAVWNCTEEQVLSAAAALKNARRGRGCPPPDPANLESVGLCGEHLAWYLLRSLEGVVHVEWVNERGETGLPYDLIIRRRKLAANGETPAEDAEEEDVFVEVKTTVFPPSREMFHISLGQVELAVKLGSRFLLLRVFCALSDHPRHAMIWNLGRCLQNGSAQLCCVPPVPDQPPQLQPPQQEQQQPPQTPWNGAEQLQQQQHLWPNMPAPHWMLRVHPQMYPDNGGDGFGPGTPFTTLENGESYYGDGNVSGR